MSEENLPLVREQLPYRGLSCKDLAKAGFDADVPRKYLKNVTAPESLYAGPYKWTAIFNGLNRDGYH